MYLCLQGCEYLLKVEHFEARECWEFALRAEADDAFSPLASTTSNLNTMH